MEPRGDAALFIFFRRVADLRARIAAACGIFLSLRPCAAALFAVIGAETLLYSASALSIRTAAWLVAGAAFSSLLFLRPKHALFYIVLPAAAGFSAMNLHLNTLTEPDDLTELMPARRAYGEMEMTVDDPAAVPGGPEEGERPKRLFARLERVRFSGEKEWRKVSVRVAVYQWQEPYFRPGFGDVLRVEGQISEPRSALVSGGFDAKKYLAGQGVRWQVSADSGTVTGRGHGLRRSLYDCRDALLARISGPMRDENAKSLAAGILFGLTDGIPAGVHRDFLRSGTVHILSVSGMHVGLFAAILLMIFAFLPFRLRYGLVILLTFFYALATGLREPALRAFLMLAAVLGSRAFLLRTDPLNTLSAVAAALLLIDPACLTGIGFQFSFLTVAALLLAMKPLGTYFWTVSIGFRWTPVKYQTRTGKLAYLLRRKLFGTAAAPVVAFAAAFALTAFYQNLLPGSGIAANLLLIPLLLPAFGCALAAAVCSFFWPWAGACFSRLLEDLMRLTAWICGLFSDAGVLDFASPPLWSVWLFLLLLAALFLPFKFGAVWRSAVVLLLCGTAAFWHFRTVCAPPEIAVFYGGGEMPAIAVALPRERAAYLAGLPDADTAAGVSDYLRARGISKIRLFIPMETGKHAARSLERLRGISLGEAVLTPAQRGLSAGTGARESVGKSRIFHFPDLTAERSGGTFRFRLDTPDCELDALVESAASGGHRVRVRSASGEPELELDCPPSLAKKYICRTLREKGNER